MHCVVPPHWTEHPALPAHSAVHPPFGQMIVHLLLPWQVSVEPVSRVTLQSLPPPQVTWLFVPVCRVHWLVPAHVDVHPEPQLPAHTDCPAHVLVHPVPHVRSQLFSLSQWYVTLFGGAVLAPAAASAPASAIVVPPPNVHVPPRVQVHVVPEHEQAPEHRPAVLTCVEPPHPGFPAIARSARFNEAKRANRKRFMATFI